MTVTPSPLRYPGGKSQLYPLVQRLLVLNNFHNYTYIEPFAGGAGLALKLLFNDDLDHIILNDLDVSIFAFWHSILNHNDDFCQLINDTPLSVEQWLLQRQIYQNNDDKNKLKLGFATFYLNRTNVSGVIKGGLIGGLQQNGKYNISSRFNKNSLIKKIQKIYSYRDKIEIYNLDAVYFIKNIINSYKENVFVNFDPPYVKKGSFLYKNSYKDCDHVLLYHEINKCTHPWILTYDVCTLIQELYNSYLHSKLGIKYSIGKTKKADEFIFFSDKIKYSWLSN